MTEENNELEQYIGDNYRDSGKAIRVLRDYHDDLVSRGESDSVRGAVFGSENPSDLEFKLDEIDTRVHQVCIEESF
jgi:hypothetical protein|tara:strand:+ start:581 stop:808 length:228 start_codon:yes stop_codon:yes gene_type:complete